MDPDLAQAFVAGVAASVHPTVRAWYRESQLHENVRAWIEAELQLVGDIHAASRFQERCPVPGRISAEYGNRIVRAGGLDVVAGIRFRRGDVRSPFVDVIGTLRPVRGAAEWEPVVRDLEAEFAGFRPAWVRFYSPDPGVALAGRRAGDVVLAARVEDLCASAAESSDAVVLRRVSAVAAYDHYLNLYRAFHAEAPRNEDLAHVEDIETLAGWESDGGLFEIRVDGMFAGYCGAKRWPRYGVRGWVGAEIILANRFRGQGLAAAVHRRVAEAIRASPGEALWADVHEDNAPSLRSGLRAGYQDIGRMVHVELSPSPSQG